MKNTRRERFLEYLELVGSATATNTAVTTEENTNEIENPMHENNQQDDNTLEDTVKQFFQEPIESFQRIILSQTETTVSLCHPESFTIMEQVKYFLQEMKNPCTVLEKDDLTPIIEDSDISKGDWAREFQHLSNKFLLSQEAENGILNLIYNTFGKQSNLPVALTVKGRSNDFRRFTGQTVDNVEDNSLSAENVTSDAKKYCRKISRWIQFDQCINDCCVFVGTLDDKFYCPQPECNSPRYRPCTRSHCKGKGTETCTHLRSDGIAWKSFFYRLLIPLIVDLIHTKYFVSALHFQNEIMQSDTGCLEFYSDILDGEVAKEHLNSMDSNYKAWCNESISNATSVPINLLLMEFYDGGQLFKYATCNFWGLFTSILNLPPTYRGKVGISQFLSAIYGGTHDSAERFLFTDLYCEELRTLYEGFEYVSPNGKVYFIQARLIFHSMDTKAQEPILCMQSMSTSRYGCPYCRNAHGQHNSWKVCFTGHRNFLPLEHYLRYFGQSGKCCPHGFYSPYVESQWYENEDFISDTNPVTAESLLDQLKGRAKRPENMVFCEPCDGDQARAEHIKAFLLSKNSTYTWIHKDNGFDFKDISKDQKGLRHNIFYRHFDFRPHIKYRRITKEEHMKSALEARELNKDRKGKKEKEHVDGFQDVWAFDRLPYADLARNSSPPPDHAIKGIVKHCFDYMFGVYKEKKPSRRKYGNNTGAKKKKKKEKAQEEHGEEVEGETDYVSEDEFVPKYRPSYHGRRAPYACTESTFDRINEMLKCVLIPVGVSDRSDWVLDLNKSGNFKIAQWKNLASVYWDYIVHCLFDVDEWYRLFYRMVGNTIRNLLSFRVHRGSIDQLQGEVNEMICLWECFYPASENYFQLHQIMDLVSSIPLFGSMHSWSDLLGEKALGYLKKIKKKSNPGGTSYEKNIMQRHVDREISILNRFYSSAVNETDKKAANYKTKVWFDEEQKVLKFKTAQFSIEVPEKMPTKDADMFNEWEVDALIELLLREIRKRYNGDEEMCIKSSYLYSAINRMRESFPTATKFQLLKYVVTADKDLLDYMADYDHRPTAEEILVATSLLSYLPTFYSNAWIYGLQFRSRGSIYREKQRPVRVRWGSEAIFSAREDLPWNNKDNFSCWCMFQQSDFNILLSQDNYRYGRINAFFEMSIGDKSIDGLLLASITSHKYDRVAINVDKITNSESLDPSNIFIALQDIFPTLIATIPIGPNLLPNKINRKKVHKPQFVNLFKSHNMRLNYSIMLKMNPDKLSCFPSKRPWTIYLSTEAQKSTTLQPSLFAKPNAKDDFTNADSARKEVKSKLIKSQVIKTISAHYTPLSTSVSFVKDPVFQVSFDDHSFSKNVDVNHSESSLKHDWNNMMKQGEHSRFLSVQPSSSISGNNNNYYSSSCSGGNSSSSQHDWNNMMKQGEHSRFLSVQPSSSISGNNNNNNSSSCSGGNSSSSKHDAKNQGHQLSSSDTISSVLVATLSNSISSIALEYSDSESITDLCSNDVEDAIVDLINNDVTFSGISTPTHDRLPSLRNIILSAADRNAVQAFLQQPATDVVVIDRFSIDMTVKKIQCLRPSTWLNDEVINFYTNLLLSELRLSDIGITEGIYCISTFFFVKLLNNGKFTYKNVTRWTKKIKIFDQKKIFIPVHTPGHWSLVFIDVLKKAIFYYCSLGHGGKRFTSSTLKWLKCEAAATGITDFKESEWTEFPIQLESVPKQRNEFDCGMFMIMVIDSLVNNIPLITASYSTSDMPEYRLKLAQAVKTGTLHT